MRKLIVLKIFQLAQPLITQCHKCFSRIEARYFTADKIQSDEELSLTEPVKHIDTIENSFGRYQLIFGGK